MGVRLKVDKASLYMMNCCDYDSHDCETDCEWREVIMIM